MVSIGNTPQPHAVCVPFPAQGHINPMLKLAKLLHHRGFYITFVHTEFNLKRLLKSQSSHALIGLPTFQFATIPDSLPPSDAEATQDIISLCDSVRKNCLSPFRKLVSKLNDENDVPRVTCIVTDCAMSFPLKLSQELGIPVVLFWTASAAGFMGFFSYKPLVEKDESYLTNGYMDTVIDWIPGMQGIRLKDLPSFVRTTDPNDIMVNFVAEQLEDARKASAIIFNTYDELEHDVLEALSQELPPIYSTGPLQLLINQEIPLDSPLNSIKSNLWKEEVECLKWLDSKQPTSVVFVNFGSITVMTTQQLVEFAWGLANTNMISFLWIIRPDLVIGESAILPQEILAETKGRGLLASWCPQEQVLSHPSIGCFLTHSGWNSTLESLCGGVPMICWPFFAEQQTNCWFCCNKWGNGMEIENDGKRGEIEKLVKEVIVGEKGKEMKMKANEWKQKAEEATTGPCGSSYVNLDKMINELLLYPGNPDKYSAPISP